MHEVFGGNNRKKSMIWGLVIPICRECHSDWDINKELRQEIQQIAQSLNIETKSKQEIESLLEAWK